MGEPGHHFEWASLLVDFVGRSGQTGWPALPGSRPRPSQRPQPRHRPRLWRRLRQGLPLDLVSRSWPQGRGVRRRLRRTVRAGADLAGDQAPFGGCSAGTSTRRRSLWIDRIDERGRSLATDVPASIFYHLVCALTQHLDGTAKGGGEAKATSLPPPLSCRTSPRGEIGRFGDGALLQVGDWRRDDVRSPPGGDVRQDRGAVLPTSRQ